MITIQRAMKYVAGISVGLLVAGAAIGLQRFNYEKKLATAHTAVTTQIDASEAEAQFYNLLEDHFQRNPDQDVVDVNGRFYHWDSVDQGISRAHATLDNRHRNLLELVAPKKEELDQMLLEEPYLNMYENRIQRYNEQSKWLQSQ